MCPKKVFFNWSSGKDSALALYHLQQQKEYAVNYLLTTVNAAYQRISMHGVRVSLMQEQVNSIGIPHDIVELPEISSNEEYETKMRKKIATLKAKGFEYAAFGDIFLEDLKQYREKQLLPQGITPLFPLWKRNTQQLIKEFLALGFKAIVVCVDASLLDSSWVGRTIDKSFIKELPAHIDPCGENGEFHTFCYEGPIFKKPISFRKGDTVYKEYQYGNTSKGYWFCDLIPL